MTDRTVQKFLSRAREASKLATYPRQKLGAVLVYGNKILASGFNTNKTNPMQQHYNKYRGFKNFSVRNNGWVHAEGMVLLKTRFLDIEWNKATIYIYRELKDGTPALAKPCAGCQIAMIERGIGTVVYTTPEGYETMDLKGV